MKISNKGGEGLSWPFGKLKFQRILLGQYFFLMTGCYFATAEAKYLSGIKCEILANRTGSDARRTLRRSASTASSGQRSNAPVMAAKNHIYLWAGT
jgi:hypothetical protein